MKIIASSLGCIAVLGLGALGYGVTTPSEQTSSPNPQKPLEHSASACATATAVGNAMSETACCNLASEPSEHKSSEHKAITQFAGFAANMDFRTKHENPLPYTFQGKGKAVTVKSTDGKDCGGYEIKPTKATKNVIFVIHEWWGLNDYVKREAESLADALGAHVIALDLYDGKVATTRDSAAKYMQTCSADRAKTIISAFTNYVGADARIGTIGWCFGGGWSHQASLLVGKQAVGCVIYYGMPESDPAKLASMSAPTLGIFAKQEKWISPEVVAKFEAAMKTAGKPLEIKSFDADHGFANPSNPKHNKEFTEEARAMVLAFFKKCFA